MATTSLPHQLPGANKTLTAACHCRSVHFTITVPTSSLPLPVHLCHCHVCRQTHGTLASFHAALPKDVSPVFIAPSSFASSLTGYTHSQGATATRLFCKTCGCHIGDVDLRPDPPETGTPRWVDVASSIFDQHTPDTFQIRSHIFTRGAVPGLAEWLPAIGGRALNTWNPGEGDPELGIPGPAEKGKEFDERGGERLRAECHCGGVSFTLPRPGIPEIADDPYISRWISPKDPNKYAACLDLCGDCRLLDGTHFLAWTFVPLAFCEPKIGPDLKIGTMVTYRSSEDVLRSFCGVCGATVFYAVADRVPTERQRIVDLAVGVLRAPEGVLAEEWMTWRTGRCSWVEAGKAYDGEFAEALARGVDEWGVKRYGESVDFKLPHTRG
ncbi:Mss4-like protein [Bombardia bombarda]|uniref:Mss4-like protein n=1 Tax=Bombardia bombarda TaxID=252184 RepID=A0AA40C1S8_9PEZI|nr:Mss4-like protein [Bombardia bombarda]